MAAAPKSPGRAASARYQAEVAASRARFLSAEAIDPGTVRRPILASWRRSLGQNVAADKVQMSYDRDVRHDTRLGRSSAPVLRALSERLEGQPVSVVLTDQRGLVLERLTGDRDLERHLDRVLLAPGFSYAEDVVGTNGIGTALEMGGPAHVFGHEHYAEDLEELACAGVPIHDPVSGRLVGAIDLTCWRRDSGSLLLTVAKTTAEQIREALTADSDASQMRVFQEYLRASRHGHGIVLAVHDDMLMINERGRSSLEPADQTAVLAHAAEARSSRQDRTVAVDLPSGQRARLDCRTVGGDDQAPGVVVHVKLDPHDLPDQEHRRSMTAPMALPGWSAPPPSGDTPAARWRRRSEPVSGWPSRARTGSASWRCCRPCTCVGSRWVATRCSTHARRPWVPSGCRRFAASSGRASTPSSSATWTASTPGPLAACATCSATPVTSAAITSRGWP